MTKKDKLAKVNTLPPGFLDSPLLTEPEAAAKLQMHPVSLRAWRAKTNRTGKLYGPAFAKMGGKIRYPQILLEQYVADAIVSADKVA